MSFETRAGDRGLDQRRDRRAPAPSWWPPPRRSPASPSRRTPASAARPRRRCRRTPASVRGGIGFSARHTRGKQASASVTNNMRHHTSCVAEQRDQLAEDGGEAPQHHADVQLDQRAAVGVHCLRCIRLAGLLDRPEVPYGRSLGHREGNMKVRSLLSVACAAVALSVGAVAAEPHLGKFISYETGRIHHLHHAQRRPGTPVHRGSREVSRHTREDARQARAEEHGADAHRHRERQRMEEVPGTRARTSPGWFQPGAFSNTMVMDGDAVRGAALQLILHEYTHFYLASQFAGEYPPWFNEGMAELMGFAKFDQGKAIMQVPMWRVYEARDGDWIPFERLIRVDHNSPEYQSHKLANSFYSQAWLTVHYGMVENRVFGKQMFQLPEPAQQPAAVQKRRPIPRLVRISGPSTSNCATTRARPACRRARIAIGEVPAVTLPPRKPVAELDALANIIDIMITTRLAPDRIRPLGGVAGTPRACVRASCHLRGPPRPGAGRRGGFRPRHRAGGDCARTDGFHGAPRPRERAACRCARLRADEHTKHREHRTRPQARDAAVRRGHRA